MGWGGESFAVGAQAVRPISAIAGPTFYLSAAQVGLSQSKEHKNVQDPWTMHVMRGSKARA